MVKGRGSKATRPTRQAAPPSRRPVPEDEDDSSSDAGAGLHAKDPYADDSEDDDEAVFDLAGSDGSSDSEVSSSPYRVISALSWEVIATSPFMN